MHIRFITLLLVLSYHVLNAQNFKLSISGGLNTGIVFNQKDNDFKNDKSGFDLGIGAIKTFGKNGFGTEIGFHENSTNIITGPFFFPIDVPPSPGNLYQYNFLLRSVNLMAFYYRTVAPKLDFYIGPGVHIPFYQIEKTTLYGVPEYFPNNSTVFAIPDRSLMFATGFVYSIPITKFFRIKISPRFSSLAKPIIYNLLRNKDKTRYYNPVASLHLSFEFF
ncbi:MAG: hypothetical protein RIR11_2338 [Bacteroidota bacterium]|jgi:hypothetical protein